MFGLRRRRTIAKLQPGRRVYAIGDLHGRLDLLNRLAERIEHDLRTVPLQGEATAVFVGDYVDRGPHSAGVLKLLSESCFPVPFVALRGNHEEMLLSFLQDAATLDSWKQFGGLETLHSFGIDAQKARQASNYTTVQAELRAALTPAMQTFLSNSRVSHCSGDYFFCHAGIRPGVPLDAQLPRDLMWIRREFLESRANHGKVIVHGHTPAEEPEILDNRINVDTGAYLTGRLTCIVLEDEGLRALPP